MEDEFTPQANKAMQSMEMFENQVDVMTKNVSKAMNNLQNLMLAGFSLNTIGGDFIRGGEKILGFYKSVASELININSEFDSIGASFKTVFGDMANEKLEWAMDFSIKTPFQVKDTTRAMSGLHAIGLDVTQQVRSATGELVPLLQAMGDLSTRNTGARGGISGMLEAVSNLYGGDGGRSLRARFDLPKTYVDELKEAVDEGGEVFAQKFADLANQLTPNAMQNMLGTWEQVVAEMEDTWDMLVWKVGKAGAFDSAKNTLKSLSKALGSLASNEQAIQALADTFNAIWKPVDLLGKGIVKATEYLTDFVVKHPQLSKFIGVGVAIGGAFMVASGAIMKLAGSVVVLGASVASLYLNFKLVKGLNLAGEFDFMFKSITRGGKSLLSFGLITGGFLLALKGKYGDLGEAGTRVAGRLQSAWKSSDDILENGVATIDDLSKSWNVVNRAVLGGNNILDSMNKQYDSLTIKLTRIRLLGTIIGRTLFGDVVDGELQYTQRELENLRSFGLLPIAQTFAVIRGRVDSFVDGVTDGISIAIDICKSFFDLVAKPFTAFFDAFDSKLKPIGNTLKSIFGIKGTDGMDLTEAEKQLEMFRQLGEATGKLLGVLLAFKAVKTITGVITSPFITLGKHINNATNKLVGFKNSFTGLFGNKNKITIDNTKSSQITSTVLDDKTQERVKKQEKYREDYLGGAMLPHRGLVGDPFNLSNQSNMALEEHRKQYEKELAISNLKKQGYTQYDAESMYENPTAVRTGRRKQVLPSTYSDRLTTDNSYSLPVQKYEQPIVPKVPTSNIASNVPKYTRQIPVNIGGTTETITNVGKPPISNLSTNVPPTQVVKIPSSDLDTNQIPKSTGKPPVSNVTVQNSVPAPKIPVSNVNTVTDNRVNTNTNTNNITRTNTNTNTNNVTRTNTTESISTKLYDQTQFKKIDGRFFNNKTPLNKRDFGSTVGFTIDTGTINSYATPSSISEVPTFGEPQVRYVNVTDREAFENRFITPQKRTTMPTRITSPKSGARGYSLDHSFIEEQGYRMSDYTNSKTRTLTNAEKQQLEINRRQKLTSGKFGGAWNKYFKIKDRVGKFMDEYDGTPKLAGNGKNGREQGKFSKVYSAYTTDRYNDFIAEAKGTNKNQTYVKNRSKLGARLFGYQHYEKDLETGEMKKLGSQGGRLKADKDDKQTRLAVEKLNSKQTKQQVAKPKVSQYYYTDDEGTRHFNKTAYDEAYSQYNSPRLYNFKPSPSQLDAVEYKSALTMRPNTSSEVGTIKSLLDPRTKSKVTLGRNNLEQFKPNETVYRANRGSLTTKLLGERYFVNAVNENGDMYEHTVARRGGLMSTIKGNPNQMRVKDEGDVSLGGRVRQVVSPVKNAVTTYTPEIVKNTGSAIAGSASNLWGSAMMLASTTGNRIAQSKPIVTASKAVGAVKDSKAYKAVANSKVGKAVGSAVHGVTTKEGIKNTARKTGNFLLGSKVQKGFSYTDSNNETHTGTRTVRRGGVSGFLLGNKQVDSVTGAVGKRKGGVLGAVKGTARGVGKVAGGAVRGIGAIGGGLLRSAPLLMMGAYLGSMAFNGIKEKGGGDFTEGLKALEKDTKSIDFSGMWDSMTKGLKEVTPIIMSIFKNTFSNLARDLPNILSNAWEGIKALGSMTWKWITTDGVEIFKGLCSSLGELFVVAWEWVKTSGLDMFTNFVSFVISDGIPLLIDGIMGIGSWLVSDGIPFVCSAIGDIVNWIVTDFVPMMLREFVSLAGKLGTALWDGITGAVSGVFSWIGEKWDGLFGKKQTVEVDIVENRTVKGTGTTSSPTTTEPSKTTTNQSTLNTNPLRPTYGVHHGGLWLSDNEHEAIIRKDETVLPPDKSKKLDSLLETVETGSKSKTFATNKTEVKETGDNITIQKVEVIVQAEKLSRADAKAQALMVIDEIKRLNKRTNITNFVY